MNVLTVFCHPNRDSFSGAILDAFIKGAADAGHVVKSIDLHADEFDPRYTKADFHLFRTGEGLPDDLKQYQKMIDAAEVMAFVYPIWWFGMPAMLKGWFDRVFSNGWMFRFETTYEPEEKHKLVTIPVLAGKKIIQLCPAGLSDRTYKKYGYDTAMNKLIDIGIYDYSGTTDIDTHVLMDIDLNPDARAEHLAFAYRTAKNLTLETARA